MEAFETLSEQLARVTAECERLREENARLRRLLPAQSRPATPAQSEPPIPQRSTPAELSVPEKIAVFRSLFRGREDVYALRWESADGKSGYSPASIRDWKAVMSVPPAERKKLDQATRQLLPINVPSALERSRSGEGGHVWIFFSAPVPAFLARKLGAGLLTRTMQRRHQISLKSYDRLFPN